MAVFLLAMLGAAVGAVIGIFIVFRIMIWD